MIETRLIIWSALTCAFPDLTSDDLKNCVISGHVDVEAHEEKWSIRVGARAFAATANRQSPYGFDIVEVFSDSALTARPKRFVGYCNAVQ